MAYNTTSCGPTKYVIVAMELVNMSDDKLGKLVVSSSDEPHRHLAISSSSLKWIEDRIDALNNEDLTDVILSLSVGTLFIFGGNDGRVTDTFHQADMTRPDAQWGNLLDLGFSEDAGEIDISIGGEVNPVPLHATVSKEVAKKVVIHYLKYKMFPTGLSWSGRMDKFK